MFEKARLKLTAWYLLIIMMISIFFSGAIYRMISLEIDRFTHSPRFAFDNNFLYADNLAQESKARLLVILVEINAVILIASGSLGYILAGRTLSPIQKMLEEQKRFVGDASHELRTPLTALKTSLEVALRDKKLRLVDAKNLIRESIDEADKLKNLSDSLLELARENNHRQPLPLEKIKVKEVIDQAVKNVIARADKKSIKINVDTNGTVVLGRADKLTEVLTILLDNAVKYSPAKTKVKVTASSKNHQATLKIQDQGMGIDPKDFPHIFERFYRADKSRKHLDEGGYGLGLAIAKKIIEEHNGKITVNSVVNRGSEFKIILPSFS